MKRNSFIKGTFITTFSIILIKIIGMFSVIPFYMIIGPQGGALYSYAYNIYLVFLNISESGLPMSISKIVGEYDALSLNEAKVRTYNLGRKVINLISFISFLTLFIGAPLISKLILGNISGGNTVGDLAFVLRCVSFAILVIPYLSVTRGFLNAHSYFTETSISNIIEQIARVIVLLLGSYTLLKLTGSLKYSVGISVFAAFLGGLVAIIYLVRILSKNKDLVKPKIFIKDEVTDKEIIIKIIKYSVPLILISLITNVYNFTDMVLIIKTLNYLKFTGVEIEFISSIISTWGIKIAMIVNSIAMGLSVTLLQGIVESYTKREYKQLNYKLNTALEMVIFISMPLIVGLSILSTPVWTIFYNTNPLGSYVFKILIFNSIFVNINMIINISLQSLNKFKTIYKSALTGFIINAILDIPFMLAFNYIGIEAYFGAIFATMLSYSISIYIGLKEISKIESVNYKTTIKTTFKTLIPLAAMSIILFIFNNTFSFNEYSKTGALIKIILNTSIGGVVYMFISYKLNIIKDILGVNNIKAIKERFTR